MTSTEQSHEVSKKECQAMGGEYGKVGSGIYDYDCGFKGIPLSAISEEEAHEARSEECQAKGGQYLSFTDDEFGYSCLEMNGPMSEH